MRNEQPREFQLVLTGEIESGEFPSFVEAAFVSYAIVSTNELDWGLMAGSRTAKSQACMATSNAIVWNVPISCTFSSTTPRGWPRMELHVDTLDWRGRIVPFGAFTMLIPSQPGRSMREALLMAPCSMSSWSFVSGWLIGRRSVFTQPDPRIASHHSVSSPATLSQCSAKVKINLNILIKGNESLNLLFCYEALYFSLRVIQPR